MVMARRGRTITSEQYTNIKQCLVNIHWQEQQQLTEPAHIHEMLFTDRLFLTIYSNFLITTNTPKHDHNCLVVAAIVRAPISYFSRYCS